jgi:von Willebrand factor type A domain/Putative metal-binding motif
MFALFFSAALTAAAATENVCNAPDALLLLDVSGTMKETTRGENGAMRSKWEWAKRGISSVMDATGARGGPIENEIAFGLSVFPKPAKIKNGMLQPQTGFCYMPSDTADDPFVVVPFGTANKTSIDNQLAGLDEANFGRHDTPIYQALLKSSVNVFKNQDRKRAIVLVTDGMQDCCRGPDYDWTAPAGAPDWISDDCARGTTKPLDTEEARRNREDIVALTASIAAQGVKVYALGFGDKVDPQMLGGIAKAGGTARDPERCDPTQGAAAASSLCYYAVDAGGSAGLTEALRDIVGKLQAEECDGIDNDCDGAIDDNIAAVPCGGEKCGGIGTQTCVSGKPVCSAKLEEEVCDGRDNDCDGFVDKVTCQTKCGPGKQFCIGGKIDPVCVPDVVGAEICNGQDDNCDGEKDEGCDVCKHEETESCKVNGTCAGTRTCLFNDWKECKPNDDISEEVCDGKDNDCDGKIDNGSATMCPVGAQCIAGRCSSGLNEQGGVPEAESFVYRGQGLSRACNAGGSPEALGLAFAIALFLRRKGR